MRRRSPRIGPLRQVSSPGYDVAGFAGNLDPIVLVDPRRETVVRDATTGRTLRRFDVGGDSSAVSPDGRLVALLTSAGVLRLLDVGTGVVRLRRADGGPAPTAMRFSPDSRTLLTSTTA